jgi:TonB family protein
MSGYNKKKRFLNLPKYPGGSEAFSDFINKNIRYPQEAVEARVAGSVIVEYDIHDDGTVSGARVLRGIGYGCDEEAVRLVSLLQYEKVKNRGIRVKMTTKTTIHFRLPGVSVNYSVSYSVEAKKKPADTGRKKNEPESYNYTIQL